MLQQFGDDEDYGFRFGVHYIRLVKDLTTEAGTIEPIGFVAIDLAKALGMRDGFNATRGLGPDQKGTHKVRATVGKKTVHCVSESGFYNVVIRSNSPEGRKLRSHVTRGKCSLRSASGAGLK